jgi:hypothetical protein
MPAPAAITRSATTAAAMTDLFTPLLVLAVAGLGHSGLAAEVRSGSAAASGRAVSESMALAPQFPQNICPS